MSFKYSAVTANCGNSTLGNKATKEIAHQLKQEGLDFCVINCQEVDFNATLAELKKALPGYSVICAGQMTTRTKNDLNVLYGNTGMASFVISKPDVQVKVNQVQAARRDPSAMFGTASNKGGVITDCSIARGNQSLELQLISGHLDSNKTMERAQDWGVIQEKIAVSSQDVKNFNELVQALPDIRLSGYDANTRSKVVGNHIQNMWEESAYELEGLKQAPLGTGRFSADSTYKSNIEHIETDPAEGKRSGFTKGGMLDFVDVLDAMPNTAKNSKIQRKQVTVIAPDDETTKRDHAVIISPPLYSIKFSDEFDQVKNQMASLLSQSAPDLARDLRELPKTDINKTVLVDIYAQYLSKEGVLNQEMDLFIQKLDAVKKASKSGPAGQEQAVAALFNQTNQPWFADVGINNYLTPINNFPKHQQEVLATISALDREFTQGNRLRAHSIESLESIESGASSPSREGLSSGSNKWSIFKSLNSSKDSMDESSPKSVSSKEPITQSVYKTIMANMRSMSPSPASQSEVQENMTNIQIRNNHG